MPHSHIASYTIRQPGTPVPREANDDGLRRPGTAPPDHSAFRPDPLQPGQEISLTLRSIDRCAAGFSIEFLTWRGSAVVPFTIADRRPVFEFPPDWPNADRWAAFLAFAVYRNWPKRILGSMPFAAVKEPAPVGASDTPPLRPAGLGARLQGAASLREFVAELSHQHVRVGGRKPIAPAWCSALEDVGLILVEIAGRLDAGAAAYRAAISRGQVGAMAAIEADRAELLRWQEIWTVLCAEIEQALPAMEKTHAAAIAALRTDVAATADRRLAHDAGLFGLVPAMDALAAAVLVEDDLQAAASRLYTRAADLGLDVSGACGALAPTLRFSQPVAGMRGGRLGDLLRLPGIARAAETADPPAWIHRR